MTGDTIVVRSNRLWGWWALAMIAVGLLFSVWLISISSRPGRAGLSSMTGTMGLLGLLAFAVCGWIVIRALRAPWRLELSRTRLTFFTSGYDLSVPWERVSGIAVAEVDRRPGCALVFDDLAAVVEGVRFHAAGAAHGAVVSAPQMQERMEASFRRAGYHLGIPARVLEMGPVHLAKLLALARTGELWQEAAE
ncbi:MAG TPA: hypothetical protein PKO09_07540 [Anaerolineae bacterium]|nr:hypothetical protein [Anaerolineae bacterium]